MAYDHPFTHWRARWSLGVQPIHEFCLHLSVGFLLRWRGNDILLLYSEMVVRLCDHIVEFGIPSQIPAKWNCTSAWTNHTAGRSIQNGGSRTATRNTSADKLPGASITSGSILEKTTTLIFLDLELVHHFIDRKLVIQSQYIFQANPTPANFILLLLVTGHVLSTTTSTSVKVQVILRPTVSRPVRLGVVPLLERVTRCYLSLSDNFFYFFM
jgi:hypothetical protein